MQAFTDANDIYTDALADQATPLAEYNAAFEDLTTANDELDEVNEALAGGQEAYTLLINEWTENVESTVDSLLTIITRGSAWSARAPARALDGDGAPPDVSVGGRKTRSCTPSCTY